MDVTVCVATFGTLGWQVQGDQTAGRMSVLHPVPVVRRHADTLAAARNGALAMVDTEWVCFLDADDELEVGFFAAMAAGQADLRAPAVRYVREGRMPSAARMLRVAGHRHDCHAECLAAGNWLVIGTVARTALLTAVGGFRNWPVYEDYDLWARCYLAGATVEAIPTAVYRATKNPRGRNHSGTHASRVQVHRDIATDLGLPVPR